MRLDDVQAGGGGFVGALARWGLSTLALGWRGAWYARRAVYGTGLRSRGHLPVPVLSVGNLAVGGTGKTPFTAWLARGLLERGRHPGILARGYGPAAAVSPTLSDEGAVLRHLLGEDVPQVERPRRLEGGRELLAAHPATDVLVLDDGFQHWALARDLDLVLLDGTCPFGHGRLLPRGRLREPLGALARADVVVITRAERLTNEQLDDVQRRLAEVTSVPVAIARTRASSVECAGEHLPPGSLSKSRVFAVCGIGNPHAFTRLLEDDLGAELEGWRFLRDHAAPDAVVWADVLDASRRAGADWVVITRKDAVKLPELPANVAVLDIDVEVTSNEGAIWAAVERALEAPPSPSA